MDTICAGDMAQLTIDFNGTGPFSVDYSANGIPQSTIQTNSDPHVISVSPTVNTSYVLTGFNANGCPGTFSGTATVAVPTVPTAVITGSEQICQGGSGTTITVTMTGIAPFTFTYTANNMNPMQVTTMSNVYTFMVNPVVGTAYRITAFNDAVCGGTFSGVAQVFVFVPASANMSGSAVFCDSADTNIMVDFNGSGPFTIEYTINGVLQPPIFTSDDPLLIPISVNATTTYVLTKVESPGCTGIPAGSATITVNYPPSYSNLSLNCNPLLNNYTVSFTVLNATLPLTLESGSGTFTGNTFVSNPIPQGTGYSFVFHDANDCGDISISGPSTCNCTTAAGTMNLAPLSACLNDTITAVYNGGFVNDGDDQLLYVLHANPALPLGAIYGWSATPSFTFQPGMTPGTTYYISAIAGNPGAPGEIDMMDLCLSVSQGTPVVFRALPTADLGTITADVCAGDSIEIQVALTGSPVFSITPAFNGVAQSPVTGINSSTYNLVVFPIQDVTITLQNVSDQFCAAGTATGSVAVSIVPPPSFGTPLITCDYVNSTYTVNFTVTGTPPFNLNGILATFNGSSFTSLPIPFGTPYLGFLTDGNNCGQDTLAGLGVCSCLSDAGVMSQNLVQACPGDTLFLPATVGAVVAPGDTLMYVMHTNATAPLGGILAWSYTPSFVFGGGMMSNVTYFVSAMVGNPNGMDEIDQTDPCLSVASSTPVRWFPAPTTTLPDTTIHLCPGQGFNLLVTLSGTPPYTLTYLENGVVKTGTPMQNFFVIGAQGLQETKIITLTAITDANGCTGTVSGTAQVFVHPPPVVTNVTPTCNFNDQTYTLEFDVLNADSSSVMVANLGGTFDPLTRHFVSDPIPVNQPYSFTVTDAWGCGSVTLSDTVDCTCVVNAGSLSGGSLVLCPAQDATILPTTGANLEPGDTLVYLLVSTPTPAAWTVLATSATPVFSFNPTTMMYGTTYYIVAVAGNISGGTIDYSDPCLSSAIGPTVLWRLPITATISGMDTICVGGTGTVQIDFTGDGPFFVTYTDGGVNQVLTNITQNPYLLSVTPGATSTYSLVGVSGAGNCLGTADGTATVQVNTPPQAVNVVATCDFTTETYVLTFDISNGSAPNGTYSISGLAGSLVDTTFTSLPMPGAQAYSLVISDDAGCSTTLSGQPNCVCTSMAGTLSNVQDACLPNGLVSGTSNGNSSLDPDDVVRYILCADPALLPMGIFAESATPQFGFQPGMTAGVTYYIVVAVGNQTNGMFDFNDPCRAFSAGFPVVFHNRPSATITGSANVCPGGNASFTVQFMGTPPFQLTYAINGVAQTPVTSPVNTFSILTNNVQFDQTFTLVSLQDAHCTGDLTGQATVTLSPEPTGSIAGGTTICVGDSTTLTLSLSGANTFNVTVSPGFTTFNGVSDGFTFQVAPTTTTTYSITNLVATGNICPPDLSGSAVVATDQVTASAVVSDFNGFNVSCPNGVDGSIALTPQTGSVPVTAVWNDGGNGLVRADLPAGTYEVTLTNQIGCTFTQVFDIQSPPELGISFDATGPTCFGDETGVISLNAINGGAGPFNLLVDDTAFGPVGALPLILDNLSSGDYVLGIEDANGCISDDTVTVPEPVALMVNLGADTTISFGDSLYLLPIHNAPQVDTFYWTPPTYLSTPFDLETWSRPLNSQRYTLYLRDENGCETTDEILVRVQKDQRVFIPNIIYPQSTTFNDIATVWGGAEVANVQYMRIYDRWGELVFERDNFAHSDPSQGWNGTFKGEYVNPAVFVYVVEVLYINGETEIFKGDITVIR
jgi:hypothetical protein